MRGGSSGKHSVQPVAPPVRHMVYRECTIGVPLECAPGSASKKPRHRSLHPLNVRTGTWRLSSQPSVVVLMPCGRSSCSRRLGVAVQIRARYAPVVGTGMDNLTHRP